MIDWTVIQSALATWVESVTGVKAWIANQNGPRPAAPYVSLRFVGSESDVAVPARHVEDNANNISVDITHLSEGMLVVELTCFAATAVGSSAAHAILQELRKRARTTARAALKAAGLGIGAFSTIGDFSRAVTAATWEPRALMTARFFVLDVVTENAPYAETAEVTIETE